MMLAFAWIFGFCTFGFFGAGVMNLTSLKQNEIDDFNRQFGDLLPGGFFGSRARRSLLQQKMFSPSRMLLNWRQRHPARRLIWASLVLLSVTVLLGSLA